MIEWNSDATLLRVTTFATTESQEEPIAQGILHELVGRFLALDPVAQEGLLLRAAGRDWIQEFDSDAIRELAARPEYTGANGAFDTAVLAADSDLRSVDDAAADRD